MRKILIITTFYPPTNTPGALRIGKFVKYLPDFGWEPIVLTPEPSPFLSKGIPKEMRIGRVYRARHFHINDFIKRTFFRGANHIRPEIPSSSPKGLKGRKRIIAIAKKAYRDWFNFPDEFWGWITPAVRIGLSIIEEEDITLIFSSSPYPSAHIVAEKLKYKTELPWIAEFRDLWTNNYAYKRSIPLGWMERWLEKETVTKANSLITVSQPLREKLFSIYKIPTYVITNGYDEEDYGIKTVKKSKKFTITYTGNINIEKMKPEMLFHAARDLLSEGEIIPDEFEICFWGDEENYCLKELAERIGVSKIVKIYPNISLQEAIKRQKESTVLLLLGWMDPEENGVYTTKIFEYLGAKRPVLSISSDIGVVGIFLSNTKAGHVVNRHDNIKFLLMRWLKEWKTKGHIEYKGEEKEIQKYTREENTKALCRILDTVIKIKNKS